MNNQRIEDLNITEYHQLAWKILSANKKLTFYVSFIYIVFALASIIPIINIITSFVQLVIGFSIIKYFFDLANKSENIEAILNDIKDVSLSSLMFKNIGVSLGISIASSIVLTILSILSAITPIFGIVSIILLAIILYASLFIISACLIQREFYYSFSRYFSTLTDFKTYKLIFSKDYFLTSLYVLLVCFILFILIIVFISTIILSPISALMFYFISIYAGMCYLYIYRNYSEKIYEK